MQKLMEMRAKVNEELEHIPRWDFYQNLLRSAYQTMRMNSLGKSPQLSDDKNVVLKEAIRVIKDIAKKEYIDFKAQYKKDFFKI